MPAGRTAWISLFLIHLGISSKSPHPIHRAVGVSPVAPRMAYTASAVSGRVRRKALGGLMPKAKALAVLEGNLTDSPDLDTMSAAADRQYILQISRYNNLDTDAPEQDLKRIMQSVKPRPNRFLDESFIAVNRSMGMPPPDEVVILFSASAKQADRFRKDDPDILKKVGALNKAHPDDYIYYMGRTTG